MIGTRVFGFVAMLVSISGMVLSAHFNEPVWFVVNMVCAVTSMTMLINPQWFDAD